MATKKKMLQAAAGNAGGGGLDVAEVFSTYLYTGTGSAQTITNGIDLDGEGGLVWIKNRDTTDWHHLCDTERGSGKVISSNGTNGQFTNNNTISGFSASGFSLGGDTAVSTNGEGYASWTFRKAPKFFDVVTYTGTGSARTISHSLNTTPGLIICKPTSGSGQWAVWHRSNGNNNVLYLNLNYSNSFSNTVWNNTAPTSTVFSVGASAAGNESGVTYVAYLFAHNDGDGEFGPSGDQDIIKCGSFNAIIGNVDVDLGFEPAFILFKSSTTTDNWNIVDNMRGWGTNRYDTNKLSANVNYAEEGSVDFVKLTSTGFKAVFSESGLATNQTYIYMAIRRGPLAPPESATEVFDMDFLGATSPNPPAYNSSGWPVDMGIQGVVGVVSSNATNARLMQGKFLKTDSTDAETASSQWVFDFQDGWRDSTAVSSSILGYMWRRAPNYFDVVAYTGEGANTVINHNLDAIPEMVWVKNRGRSQNWNVYHKDLELNGDPASECRLFLSTNSAVSSGAVFWGTHTDTTFTMTVQNFQTNYPNDTYIAYLFATLAGVSKVGSYTGNGSSQTINCGFTSGARFILVKRTDSTGDWYVWDTERGIVAGNDPHLSLNSTAAQVTSDDSVDPDNSGFIVNQVAATNINVSSSSYIFYAIA